MGRVTHQRVLSRDHVVQQYWHSAHTHACIRAFPRTSGHRQIDMLWFGGSKQDMQSTIKTALPSQLSSHLASNC